MRPLFAKRIKMIGEAVTRGEAKIRLPLVNAKTTEQESATEVFWII